MNELAGLPAIDPAEAQLRADLLSPLNGRALPGALLSARLPARPPRAAHWFSCTGSLAFALDRLAGRPVMLSPADAAEAVDRLGAAETLLRAIEGALGIELEPQGLETAPPAGETLFVTVEALAQDRVRDRLHLALPRTLRLATEPCTFAPDLLRLPPFRRVPFPVALAVAGPRLAPHEAADLDPGDLLLLGPAPLAATIALPGMTPVTGGFDPAARRFTIHDPIKE